MFTKIETFRDEFYEPVMRIVKAKQRNLDTNKALDNALNFFSHIEGVLPTPNTKDTNVGWMRWDIAEQTHIAVGFSCDEYLLYYTLDGETTALERVVPAKYTPEVRDRFISKIKEILVENQMDIPVGTIDFSEFTTEDNQKCVSC